MNAAKQIKSIELLSKIATLEVIFKTEFTQGIADFNPWLSDTITEEITDPNSIDISFSFPGEDFGFNSRCILIQIRFSETLLAPNCRIIGIEALGYNHQRQQWRFSTIGDWQFEGVNQPISFCQEKFRRFARQIFILFKHPIHLNCW
ncbi:hypothetical protein IQ247_21650 [Plectonema cf. radiosum LEGE 06105]|uniref:Uncharacterized protein n=1 Tax=Plectonema cf. radiosum LEGE 06105 TaxID=945769 RepID=A0A8J7K2D1_9CYAN|nr:hypothetical protein [Plectonema radiosum]MBE9215236.1 hypothetical protein [Plectonema cf. radiosum LEGE 06105]